MSFSKKYARNLNIRWTKIRSKNEERGRTWRRENVVERDTEQIWFKGICRQQLDSMSSEKGY